MTRLRIAPGLALVLAGAIAFATPNRGEDTARLRIGGGTLDITFDAAPSPALRQLALDWITRAAKAVTVYYTRFPVRHVGIAIHVREGNGARGGRTSGDGGPHIITSPSEPGPRPRILPGVAMIG